MNKQITQDLARQAKISLLQWRIERARHQVETCQAGTPESRALMLKLIALIHRRNSLYTPADVRQIEREKGLA